MIKSKKVLVVAAHPDDEIIGCGGTLLKHIFNKDEVCVVFAADGESSRTNNLKKILIRKKQAEIVKKKSKIKKTFFLNYPDNQMDTCKILDVSKSIYKVIQEVRPDIIYTHHYNDLNIDHRITFEAVMVACRPVKNKKIHEIYCFEILSSSEWSGRNSLSFRPNVYVDISKFFKKKIELMKLYKNEIRPSPHPRSLESIKFKSRSRGSEVHSKYAEAFELIRIIR